MMTTTVFVVVYSLGRNAGRKIHNIIYTAPAVTDDQRDEGFFFFFFFIRLIRIKKSYTHEDTHTHNTIMCI